MGDEDSISRDCSPSPPSRHQKWKRDQLRPNGEYTSDASRTVAEKINQLVVEEHDGCVHGVGEGVGLRLFYGSSRKSTKQTQNENIDHFEMLEEQRNFFDEKLKEEEEKYKEYVEKIEEMYARINGTIPYCTNEDGDDQLPKRIVIRGSSTKGSSFVAPSRYP
ncbi:hypothetical protein KIW84_055306 [Lathyrus oleraceus]|uniref:Uncharacterized protein n=1 Tax=Pisum sativum TaxID=3888 RepID=A0A9D4WVF5_PEA|nr:hypothetical protein KIW84_055306 [Pisum sativum]